MKLKECVSTAIPLTGESGISSWFLSSTPTARRFLKAGFCPTRQPTTSGPRPWRNDTFDPKDCSIICGEKRLVGKMYGQIK